MKLKQTIFISILCTVVWPLFCHTLSVDNTDNNHYGMWLHFNSSLTGSDWKPFVEPGDKKSLTNNACFTRISATVNVPQFNRDGEFTGYRNGGTFSYSPKWPWYNQCKDHPVKFEWDGQQLCMIYNNREKLCLTKEQAETQNALYQF